MNALCSRGSKALAVLLLCGQALGQSYSIQVLSPLPGYTESFGCGVNESGVVVGSSRNSSAGRATRWIDGVPSDLGTLTGWQRAVALDISTDGTTIVGEANVGGSTWVPFVWENGVLTAISGPALSVAGCWQMNDSGVIVGRAFGANPPIDAVACRWDKVGGSWVFSALPPLPGMGAGAFGINNAGVIAGFSGNSWSGGQVVQAVRWNGGAAANLSGFAAGSSATSCNISGHCVGDFELTSGGNWHAQYHNGVAPIDLGTLVYANSYAHRINASGTIIGQSYGGADPTAFPMDNKLAILWRAGTMNAVNDLISPSSGWDVKQLWDLSDSGRIVGYGRFNGLWRGCLLVPVCYADCDGVGGLTGNDFQCFLNSFVSGSSYANCDGVGGLTGNDFQCFLNKFVAGCS